MVLNTSYNIPQSVHSIEVRDRPYREYKVVIIGIINKIYLSRSKHYHFISLTKYRKFWEATSLQSYLSALHIGTSLPLVQSLTILLNIEPQMKWLLTMLQENHEHEKTLYLNFLCVPYFQWENYVLEKHKHKNYILTCIVLHQISVTIKSLYDKFLKNISIQWVQTKLELPQGDKTVMEESCHR